MKRLLPFLWLVLAVLLPGCGIKKLLAPSPTQKLRQLVAQHPELVRRDTVRDTVKVAVPQLLIRTQVRVVHDTIREAHDTHLIDSLLWTVGRDLSDAQHQATKTQIIHLLSRRPSFPGDTLRADTLGIHLRVWLARNAYQVRIRRDEISTKVPVNEIHDVLAPTGQPIWYADRHIWIIIGLSVLCLLLLLAAIRR